MGNRRITIREIAEVGIIVCSVHSIFTEIVAMRSVCKICAKAVNDGAEGTLFGSFAGHVGLCKN